MHNSTLRRLLWALAGVLLLTFSVLAAAEPPSRAARLGFISGTVSFSPAGQRDWVQAAVNRPLTTGDRLWTGGSSRAELQVGGAAIRMGPSTSMVLLNLDDRIAQVQVSQGTLKIRVRSLGPRQTFEVATPNLAFTLRRIGEYRIEVDPNDDATVVRVERGEAEVFGEGASYTVNSRRAYRFYGNDLSDYETLTARQDDDLDRWSRERDRRGDRSVSARYVSSEVVGYEDLDANGTWRVDATYGNVWTPRRVASDWTPYRDGHWSWVDPWGWTWVDDAPWGYAVSHYGRWAHLNGSWAWVPGPRRERAVYAPALVAFVGGGNFQISVSAGSAPAAAVGWFPLAPREVYRPSYAVSRGYFDNINRSNAAIAPTIITNVYNTTIVNNTTTQITNVIHANQQVRGAVVAVPAQAFVQSQPVARANVRLAPEALVNAPVLRVASVAPVQQSVQGGAREAVNKPPAREHRVVARTAPPPAPLAFAAQQTQLAAKPGTPIDEAQRKQIEPAAPAAAAPKISVVAAAPVPTPTALPPATPPAGKSREERRAAADKADAGRREARNPDADKAAAATAEAARTETARGDAAKAAAARAAESKAADAKAADAKAAEAKAAETKAAEAKTDAARTSNAKAEAGKADEAKAERARADTARADASKAAVAKAAEARAAEAKADATRTSNAKAEAGKADEAKAERARADTAKADASKADAATAEARRTDAAKLATAKAEAAKAEAAKADASKAAAAQAATERAEASKAAAAKAAAEKAAEARAAEAKVSSARADAAKAEEAGAERVRRDAAKAEASKAQAVKAEAARADAAKAATAQAESAKSEAAKAEASRADAAKAAAAKAETARAQADKVEAAQAGRVKAEAAKADSAKADAARVNADKAEAAKAAALAKASAAAPPPRQRGSGTKPDADANPENEKKKEKEARKS